MGNRAREATRSPERGTTVIRARVRSPQVVKFTTLWSYRELIYFFVWRDIKVRYRQTVLGGLWAILQPFVTMVIFSVVFGRLAGISSDGLPYPIFSFTALLPWTLFATGVSHAANSLVGHQNLLEEGLLSRGSPYRSLPLSSDWSTSHSPAWSSEE